MSTGFKEIDLTYLEGIADGDQEIIKELITIFMEQVPEFVEGFENGFSEKNWKLIAALAHKAKSSVISMGMSGLGNIDLKNLELIAKQLRISELQASKSGVISDFEEINQLKRNFESYPKQRQDWVKNNISEESVNNIIKKFNTTCWKACTELKTVLERD